MQWHLNLSFFKKTFLVAFVFVLLISKLSTPVSAAPIRGVNHDMWADIVLGKHDFNTVTPYSVVADRLYLPHGVWIDRSNALDNKMYIYDAGNNRILGFDLPTCLARVTNPLDCQPQIVIGQTDFTSSTCNGDSAFQNFPTFSTPTASTLCGQVQDQVSVSEGGAGVSMVTDASGNLYVGDPFNHRVLKYLNPFTTDTVADDVWGQTDFTGNQCNKGMDDPDATSLCYSWGNSNNWTMGVDLDSSGNLWVADNGNNRVLRFPFTGGSISKTADLVLGQADFVSNGFGTGLNQMHDPSAVRVTAGGVVFVSEHYNNRVLKFTSPTTGGSGVVFGSGFSSPSGLDFDPTESGRIWIINQLHDQLELWDIAGGTKIRTAGTLNDGNIIGDGSGSTGVDSSGNLYIANGVGIYNNSVIAFNKGDDNTVPSHVLFTPDGNGNLIDKHGMGSISGIAVSHNQLIAADDGRILFWNMPGGISDLTTGKDPDGFVGALNFTTHNDACCSVLKTDDADHLYTTTRSSGADIFSVQVYNLPLTSSASAVATIKFPLNVLGGGTITYNDFYEGFTGILPAPDASYLWISSEGTHRVFRVRNPLTSPVIDVVLGQTNTTGILPNQGGAKTAATMQNPGAMSFDRLGNLYISDHALEIRGNFRLLEYNAGKFATNNSSVIFATAADNILDDIASFEPAFDSLNRMIVGLNNYYPSNAVGSDTIYGRHFPKFFNTPITSSSVRFNQLNDYFSMAYDDAFDSNNNLYIGDYNRGRLLVYKQPLTYPITVSEVTPVTTPSTTTTPSYTFNTTVAGTITYGGSCSSSTTAAIMGDNTITFSALSAGTYSNCTIQIQDVDANTSNTLAVTSFTITGPAPTSQPESNNNSSGGGGGGGSTSSPSAPGCNDRVPIGHADLFQINRTGKTAKLYFTPVNDNTEHYHVIFGLKEGDERYAGLSESISREKNLGVQSVTINELNPGKEYWFKVAGVNGCAVGDWSNWLKAGRVSSRTSIFYKYVPAAIRKFLR